jgi:NAD(P)-dependent dehydrogenase (short-subunit alcohol dehydrogenase family)
VNGSKLERYFGLAGKVALITGATGGIGRAMVDAFTAAGASVAISSDDGAACTALCGELSARLASLVGAHMSVNRAGSIVLTASIAGLRGNKNIGLYAMSKAALIQLARNLAVEWGPFNVRAKAERLFQTVIED